MSTAFDGTRTANIAKELFSRATSASPTAPEASAASLKLEILNLLKPYGDPATRVPPEIRDAVDTAAQQLERRNALRRPATADASALEGRWAVRFSDAPPPSNGAIGPFVGEALQVIDVGSRTYANVLRLFGGTLTLTLDADFEPRGDDALRVFFRSLSLSVLGLRLPPFAFPMGTERTWLLTYTDADTRLVRAGVDGGKSTVRDLGLIGAEEGQAADSYLFVLTRAPEPPPRWTPGADRRRAKLKAQLLAACEGQRLGFDSSKAQRDAIASLMEDIAELNPTADPARSPLLQGLWQVGWTTESELLFLTAKGLPGLPGEAAYQCIRPAAAAAAAASEASGMPPPDPPLELINRVALADGNGLRVVSSCEPSASSRVDFRFSGCDAKLYGLSFPLPPVGTGWFDVIYLDEELRVCRDSRGDLQVCTRRPEGEVEM